MKLIRYISELGEVPKGWGVCWKRMNASTASAIAPIPFNLLIRWGRALWLWAVVGRWGGIEDRYLAESHKSGHNAGYRDGVRELSEFVRNAQADRWLNRDLDEFKRRQKEKASG